VDNTMPHGAKISFNNKQNRQAAHSEAVYDKMGGRVKTGEAQAWSTVHKHSVGGKKSGSGRKRHEPK
jgi:hypothetical protein